VRFRYRPNDRRGTRSFTLPQAQFDRLTSALTRARGFAVTYRGRTVVVDEMALKQGKVPQRLTRVLSLLNRLLDSKVPTPQNRAP
jgi:hypothetical protein